MLEKGCVIEPTDKLLLLDTVGATAGAALVEGESVVASAIFPGRSASAVIVAELRRMLGEAGWTLRELSGIGVVAGPGSFTGVRTGLATAKGLCEAVGLPLAAVSRLEVLADVAGLREGFVVVDAGRGGLFVREVRDDGTWNEWLATVAEVESRAAGATVVVAEEKVAERLAVPHLKVVATRPEDMLPSVRRSFASGGTDVAWADANYVARESDMYKRPVSCVVAEGTAR